MLKFTDGSDVYNDFNQEYKQHKKGFVILAPSGTGKTTFVNNQIGIKKNWIDSDSLFGSKSLNIDWMNSKNEVEERLSYLRADYMLEQSKLYGYRIIGSLFYKYKADAVVLIPLNEHIEYVKLRKDLNIDKIKQLRKTIAYHAYYLNIPVFSNINSAIEYLENHN